MIRPLGQSFALVVSIHWPEGRSNYSSPKLIPNSPWQSLKQKEFPCEECSEEQQWITMQCSPKKRSEKTNGEASKILWDLHSGLVISTINHYEFKVTSKEFSLRCETGTSLVSFEKEYMNFVSFLKSTIAYSHEPTC